jgi:hypothetical protein
MLGPGLTRVHASMCKPQTRAGDPRFHMASLLPVRMSHALTARQ